MIKIPSNRTKSMIDFLCFFSSLFLSGDRSALRINHTIVSVVWLDIHTYVGKNTMMRLRDANYTRVANMMLLLLPLVLRFLRHFIFFSCCRSVYTTTNIYPFLLPGRIKRPTNTYIDILSSFLQRIRCTKLSSQRERIERIEK